MFGVLRPSSPERGRVNASSTASPPPARSLAPMPSSVFQSREELLEGCKDWSSTQGYAIVIARSRANRLWLKCDRGGTYENRRNLTPDQRKRKRGDSRLLGCPFRMIAACRKDGCWAVDTEMPDHNHEPSEDLSAHPTLRRMTDQQLQKVHDMCDAGRSPAETLEELRKLWPDIKVLTRDIYNARKKYKTLKDEAEAAGGTTQDQTYQDPNELGVPGPNPNGRWAWVPDGEEVTNKKSKRKQKNIPSNQPTNNSTLDPQLQPQNTSLESPQPDLRHQIVPENIVNPQDPAEQLRGAAEAAYRRADHARNAAHNILQPNGISSHVNYNQGNHSISSNLPPHQPQVSSERPTAASCLQFQSQAQAAPASRMSSAPNSADMGPLSAKAAMPKALEVMSRIERMEKEQADQKNMLAQILGAVQRFRESPVSEARA